MNRRQAVFFRPLIVRTPTSPLQTFCARSDPRPARALYGWVFMHRFHVAQAHAAHGVCARYRGARSYSDLFKKGKKKVMKREVVKGRIEKEGGVQGAQAVDAWIERLVLVKYLI